MASQRQSLEPIAIQLTSEQTSPKSLPVEHIGSPTLSSPAQVDVSTPTDASKKPFARLEVAASSQLANPASPQRQKASAPTVRHDSTDSTHQEEGLIPASKEPNFLTLLAAQERRVLEIREELQRAEDDLRRLKKEWASHESSRKRNEGRRIHQMRPLSTGSPSVTAWKDDPDGSSAWMYEEMQRRKALMGRGRKSSRRVFSGSRTPRPLSLVAQRTSPIFEQAEKRNASVDAERPGRVQQTPDLLASEKGRFSPTSFYRSTSSSPQRQSMSLAMASEWKDGLWTFFEDLKHATVGDEPRIGHNSADGQQKRNSHILALKQKPGAHRANGPSKSERVSIRPDDDAPLIDVNRLIDPGRPLPRDRASKSARKPSPSKASPARSSNYAKQRANLPLRTSVVDGESWETWDSPDAKQLSSAHSTNTSFSTGNVSPSLGASTAATSAATSASTSADATPRQSLGIGLESPSESSSPWPSLNLLTPGQIRRTTSHLMDEWEKSLVQGSGGRKSLFRNDQPSAEQLGLG